MRVTYYWVDHCLQWNGFLSILFERNSQRTVVVLLLHLVLCDIVYKRHVVFRRIQCRLSGSSYLLISTFEIRLSGLIKFYSWKFTLNFHFCLFFFSSFSSSFFLYFRKDNFTLSFFFFSPITSLQIIVLGIIVVENIF